MYNLASSMAAAYLETFNPVAYIFCYYATYPADCKVEGSPNFGQCSRGHFREFFLIGCALAVPIIFSWTLLFA